ncbi:enoyl-CoA hydratase/isomerase family protein [Pseudomonas citronellolis]|uniref:enoyl-CoA hydratase/isomerase family protein n=1 Tax=Pseudomonas citronellolis TaxID=53408 RepID=UPI0021C202B5|nr:enoyl-CoA hydratase-related protein [Pseudomonas citronellolis]UXJ50848.1 enoyl-CoA hydratase-related protein [Pseudomonas citronellolis]
MSSPVCLTLHGAVALIRVGNPPVNALGQAVRAGLLEAVLRAGADPVVKLLLLYCEGRTFIAGADIREFGQPPQAPLLPEVTAALEACPKPILAVLHGSTLGGGLEVALACHYRICRRDARLGLPEVKLGLLPGADGTQRLPRLVGVARALAMIVDGEPIDAPQAQAYGLLDELYDGEPLAAGLAFAETLLARGAEPRRTGERPVAPGEGVAALLVNWRERITLERPGSFSPLRCIAAIEAAVLLPLEQGLARERALFLECLASPQRAELVAKFFADREAARAAAH